MALYGSCQLYQKPQIKKEKIEMKNTIEKMQQAGAGFQSLPLLFCA
jgi:hypothetical protein